MRTAKTSLGLVAAVAFKTGSETRLPAEPCPACGELLDVATGEKGAAAREGDLSVCVYCAAALTFGPNLEPLLLTDEVYEALPGNARAVLDNTRALIRQAMAGRPRRGVQA